MNNQSNEVSGRSFDWNTWGLAVRLRTLPAAAAGVITGSALAWYDGFFRLDAALACLSTAILLQICLALQVAYNERRVFFRYRWPAAQPHVYADVLRSTGGKWERQLRTPIGSDPDGIAEDRVAMMLDDGGVPEFQRYGGYVTVGAGMRDFTGSGADAAHRRKYLPATRQDPADWYSINDQATLDAQRKTGYFLDLWQWPAHLSNPLGYADDQHIAWYRLYHSGDPLFFTNWDADSSQPRWMFDPAVAGGPALRWDDVKGIRDLNFLH